MVARLEVSDATAGESRAVARVKKPMVSITARYVLDREISRKAIAEASKEILSDSGDQSEDHEDNAYFPGAVVEFRRSVQTKDAVEDHQAAGHQESHA